jgi:hypothetical protein
MTTDAKTRANRANAQKSTGPKTEAGKARSRLNALKHGRRSKAVAAPVLPQEDAAELGRKIQEWIESYQPDGAVETDLVIRAAKASWALDRADRHETALLARRVRRALVSARSRRTATVCDLGRKLLFMAGKRLLPGSGPDWSDDPAAFVAELEAIPEGARWLRDRWAEVHNLILADEPWTYLDQFKFIRLLGRQPFEAIDDPAVNAVFLAWEAIEEGWGVRFWKLIQEQTPYDDPAFSAWRAWRVIAPRPADKAAGVAHLLAVAAAEIGRLEVRIAELDAADGDDAVETAERASFSPGDDAERFRRFQSARSRELMRTLDTLNRLRKETAARDKKAAKPATAIKPDPTPPPCPPPPAAEPEIEREAEAATTIELAPAPSPAPAARKPRAAARASAPTRPAVVAIDPDEAPPTFQVDALRDDPTAPDSAAIKLLRGSHREASHSIRANEAAPIVAKVVSRDELAWSRCNPFPRERTHAADPGMRRKVETARAGLEKKKADGPRGVLSGRRPRDRSGSAEAVSSPSASSPAGGSLQASRSRC